MSLDGNVGLGLVIIVVADEIFDGVLREERLEFVIELRGERLVVREDDRGAIELLDHLGHREGLARAGDAEQHLVAVAVGQAADELRDGLRLVAAGLVVAGKFEFHGASPLGRNLGYSKLSIIPLLSKWSRSPLGWIAQATADRAAT